MQGFFAVVGILATIVVIVRCFVARKRNRNFAPDNSSPECFSGQPLT